MHEDGTVAWDKIHGIIDDLKKDDIDKDKSDSDEKFAIDLATSFFKGLIDTCRDKKIHGDTPGQTAVMVHNCLLEEYEKLGGD